MAVPIPPGMLCSEAYKMANREKNASKIPPDRETGHNGIRDCRLISISLSRGSGDEDVIIFGIPSSAFVSAS